MYWHEWIPQFFYNEPQIFQWSSSFVVLRRYPSPPLLSVPIRVPVLCPSARKKTSPKKKNTCADEIRILIIIIIIIIVGSAAQTLSCAVGQYQCSNQHTHTHFPPPFPYPLPSSTLTTHLHNHNHHRPHHDSHHHHLQHRHHPLKNNPRPSTPNYSNHDKTDAVNDDENKHTYHPFCRSLDHESLAIIIIIENMNQCLGHHMSGWNALTHQCDWIWNVNPWTILRSEIMKFMWNNLYFWSPYFKQKKLRYTVMYRPSISLTILRQNRCSEKRNEIVSNCRVSLFTSRTTDGFVQIIKSWSSARSRFFFTDALELTYQTTNRPKSPPDFRRSRPTRR